LVTENETLIEEKSAMAAEATAASATSAAKKTDDGAVARLEAELAHVREENRKSLVDAQRLLDAAEHEAIKEELARDAAIADLQQQVVREREKRAELERDHEKALEAARDEALLQALADLKASRKK
jgi:hypothetical protein